MKFLTYKRVEAVKVGIMDDNNMIYSLSEVLGHEEYGTMLECIAGISDAELARVDAFLKDPDFEGVSSDKVKILAPITKPIHDIICVGVNYLDHLNESKNAMNDDKFNTVTKPVYFGKRTQMIVGSDAPIKGWLEVDENLDYEVELAVIIGKKGTCIPKDKAEEYIFGYSVFNDFSSRKLQTLHMQWYRGKSLDTYTAMGPVILHKSMMPFPVEADVISRVNGEVRQSSNTRMLINDIAELISDFSNGITLEPGDIIATGTPAGVGMGFSPQRFLKRGDVVECEIPGIGILKNTVE
ncbi:MAG TPA: hydrolase [Tissierellales bacterium]|jgi:2-keto-4-pentenoate hydratase/2-oxohepta-3-ene-1,7-dioic acid hydratase in catechol pathway|nr:hydrolase [Tissierellales bacterium]